MFHAMNVPLSDVYGCQISLCHFLYFKYNFVNVRKELSIEKRGKVIFETLLSQQKYIMAGRHFHVILQRKAYNPGSSHFLND